MSSRQDGAQSSRQDGEEPAHAGSQGAQRAPQRAPRMPLGRIAWRNLWRNPRRTGLTTAATVFAVVLTLWTLALAAGSHARWIDTIVRLYPGHVEVSANGYRENRTLDHGMQLTPESQRALDGLSEGEGWVPRLESWALAIPDRDDSLGRATWLVGVDPARERGVSRLGSMVGEGRFLDGEPGYEVVLGETLADNLDARVGDSVILLSTDYYGSQAADRFRVVGTVSVGEAAFDDYAAIVRLGDLQGFLEFPDGLSHVAVFAPAGEGEDVDLLETELSSIFDSSGYEVVPWQQLIPDVVQMLILDDVGAWLMVAILVVVVGFGILNTILMSVFERVREFGVMRAVGMAPSMVFRLVLIESAVLAALGIGIGLLLGVPFILWLQDHPIQMTSEAYMSVYEVFRIEPVIVFSLRWTQLVGTPLVIFAISILAAIPPALRASRGRPVDALREI
jgi:ABC-type lipoprotein release transport system permease subunit